MKNANNQIKETLAEAGFELIERNGKEVILKEISTLNFELWAENDNFTGYVVEIDGKGYEFVRSLS